MPETATKPVHELTFQNRLCEIPAAAMRMKVGVFEFGDNGEDAKTAPVRMVARSGKPISHWYWGCVVHDLDGMTLHKSHLPIDWSHTWEAMGYLNKFEQVPGDDGIPDLVCHGALVPYKGDDKATEVIFKARHGVPYEASIDFCGDGIRIEELQAGASAKVNGYTLDGPAVIIREWPLRGVAVCLYGADMHTESQFRKDHADSVRVALFSQHKETDMSEQNGAEATSEQTTEDKAVEATETKDAGSGAEAGDKPTVETSKPEAEGDQKPVETEGKEASVEAGDKPTVEASEGGEQASELSADAGRVECKRFIDAFGPKGATWFAEGLAFEASQEKFNASLAEENDVLKKRLAAAGVAEGEEEPVKFQPAEEKSKPAERFTNALPAGLAKFAGAIKLPADK